MGYSRVRAALPIVLIIATPSGEGIVPAPIGCVEAEGQASDGPILTGDQEVRPDMRFADLQ